MRKSFIILLVILFVPFFLYAQQPQTGTGLSPNPTGGTPDWGTNSLLLNYEPIGPMAGVTTPNGTIYVVINDTLSTANAGLIIRKSTDNGATWTTHANSITNRINFPRLEMMAISNDTVLCWLLFGTQVYRWNIMTNAIKGFDSTTVNDFDVVKSSTNSVYLWITTQSNGLRRWASTDNGYTWQNVGYVASASRNIRLYMSATSDTLFGAYRSYLNPVPEKSIIRIAKYRESAPGTLSSISFTSLTDSAAIRTEFDVAASNSTVWFYYTEGTTSAIDIYCRTSTDNGLTYSSPFLAAGNPNVDEYYFSLGISGTSTPKYCDFIYYSDSIQTGGATNNTDKLMYKYSSTSTPGTYNGLTQISQFYPNWSAKGYKPIVVELGNGDVGAAWVGGSAAGKKIYWNRYSLTTNAGNENQTPLSYKLEQNYPNPFNPVTKINYAVAKNGFVSLKVYDVLGREVAALVNKNMPAGKYSVDFNASKLTSGVYFYSLETNGFKDVKKMMLIK
jgi:hypothetical protein